MQRRRPSRARPRLLSRRVFVRAGGEFALGAALAPWLGCESAEPHDTPDGSEDAASALPTDCLPLLAPVAEFFREFGGNGTVPDWSLPELDASSFRLRIDGLVERPLELSLAQLEAGAEHHVTVLASLMCVHGEHGTGLWTGTPLRVLLDRTGIDRARARRLRLTGADGFAESLRLIDIYDSADDLFEPLLAFRLYGAHLPQDLGFPFRALIADHYGYKSIKWLARIEVTDIDEPFGQYAQLGLQDEGIVEPRALVQTPRQLEVVPAGRIQVCGYALSGYEGVADVALSVDGGPYQRARLATLDELRMRHPEIERAMQLEQPQRFSHPFRAVFAVWSVELEVAAGEHTLAVRAHDRTGRKGEGIDVLVTAR